MSVKIKAKNPSNQLQTLLCDANGRLMVDAEVQIDNVGLATSALQGAGLPSALSSDNLKVSLKETITVPVSNDGLTELASAIFTGVSPSTKMNVNIASGVIPLPSGASTSALQTTANSELSDIHDRQDDILTASNASKLSLASLDTNFSAHKTANNTHLTNIYSRQDSQLVPLNAIALSSTTTATKTSALLTANHTDLGNIFSRQDDILTSNNATKLSVATVATKMTSLENTNHTDLLNLYNRQDDILTSTNAVKTNTQSLEDCVASNKVNVNISSGIGDLATESTLQTIAEFNCDTTDTTITSSVLPSGASTSAKQGGGLPSALSSDNLKISLKETIDLPITNGALTELASAINSDKVDVNISSGGFDGAITHSALTELASALNSDKLDVNISSGNISGFSTSANQSTANGHLLALANVVNPAIATATATTIPNKLDTIETTANAIETKTTLHTTSELKELLSGITVNAGAVSSEFDFENYRHARFFGISTASVGTDIVVMGSNTSGGVYYIMGENLRSETIGSTHHIYSPHIENLPRYIKILNKSGSTNYIFTKLYVQLSEGRVAV